jgi:hypothetical protein
VSEPHSPYENTPPPAGRLWKSVALALAGAVVILVTVVLPAEYSVDPTGIGRALGLTALKEEPVRAIRIVDVVGGNETVRELSVEDPREPTPLPNPAVFQAAADEYKFETVSIVLEPQEQTEIKTALPAARAIVFSWIAEGGEVYVDFHGHDPNAGDDFWVRYEEQQSGTRGAGSLVAPFDGEHGWYWLNVSDTPVTITLKVSGYYDKLVDYGKSKS